MKLSTFILFACASVLVSACDSKTTQSVPLVQAISDNAKHMSVRYQVVSNTAEQDCDEERAWGECYTSTLSLKFTSPLPAQGWAIYFSHLSPIQQVSSDAFKIEHIKGDLLRLTATSAILANTEYTVDLRSDYWSVSKSDVLPNYFFAYDHNKTAVIAATIEQISPVTGLGILPHAGSFTLAEQIKRNAQDKVVADSAESIFARNQAHTAEVKEPSQTLPIIPSVKHFETQSTTLNIANGVALPTQIQTQFSAAMDLLGQSNISLNEDGVPVSVIVQDSASDEIAAQSYQLDISQNGIQIQAGSVAGAFYALVTLADLVDSNQNLPIGKIQDGPRYNFRGVHLDVARNFKSLEFVLSLIEQMAQLKLNKLHLHLADDEGWRLAIEALPELTEVGGFRCFDLSEQSCLLPQLGSGPDKQTPVNGYYSASDYIQILQYAQQRHIEVIPSLDMPGHSRAAIASMLARYKKLMDAGQQTQANQYLLTEFADQSQYLSVQNYDDNTLNPCISATYTFVDTVLSELIDLHKQANVPLVRYHIGADETAGAWGDSPACQALIAQTPGLQSSADLTPYFVTKVAMIAAEHGVIPAGWSDGMGKVDSNVEMLSGSHVQVNVWDTLVSQGQEVAYEFADKGWKTILSFPDVLYFDFPYAVSADEPGYYWASRNVDSLKVFQFMSSALEQHARLWTDRTHQQYEAQPAPEHIKQTNIEGIQAHLWTEIVRHDSVAEYMYFPRLISFAERAWSIPEWEKQAANLSTAELNRQINQDWASFSHTLVSKTLPRLVKQLINFRLPPPGAKIQDGTLQMNHLYHGLQLEYRQGEKPWQIYSDPIRIDLPLKIRARLPSSNHFSTSLEVN